MFDGSIFYVSDVPYLHPLAVVSLCLISSWIPSFFGGLYRLLRPLLSALAAVIRKFTIF